MWTARYRIFLLLSMLALATAANTDFSTRSLQSQDICDSTLTCQRGGFSGSSSTCDRTTQACPPCIVNGEDCFELQSDGECPFGIQCPTGPIDNSGTPEPMPTPAPTPPTTTDNQGPTEETPKKTNNSSSDIPVIVGISGGALVLLAIGAALFFMIKDKKEDLEHDSDVEDRHFHSNNHGARNSNGNFRQHHYQQPKASPVVPAYASTAVPVGQVSQSSALSQDRPIRTTSGYEL